MKISDVPFSTIDWSTVPPVEHPGLHGKALWKTFEMGNIRVRMVEYTEGYVADHWCKRGHILFVLRGKLKTELSDGSVHTLTAGMSYHVEDDLYPHRSSTEGGATLFIVD